jgi:hypothetical protein
VVRDFRKSGLASHSKLEGTSSVQGTEPPIPVPVPIPDLPGIGVWGSRLRFAGNRGSTPTPTPVGFAGDRGFTPIPIPDLPESESGILKAEYH